MKMVGRIKWFNQTKGYGFVETLSCCHILVRCPSIENGYIVPDLKENEQVEFNIQESLSGPFAINVKRIENDSRGYSSPYSSY